MNTIFQHYIFKRNMDRTVTIIETPQNKGTSPLGLFPLFHFYVTAFIPLLIIDLYLKPK